MKTNLHNQIILLVLVLMISSSLLKAQTGGPGQPEFMQFQQAGTDNMVNPSTGTFSYQIPLFTIGGYPMNLTYQSGIQMEDVSSMVGLGWNLNPGSVVRTTRGLPDDFSNDLIKKEYSVKENKTYGGKLGVDLEIAGLPFSIGCDIGIFWNNYKGWGMEPSLRGNLSYSYKVSEGIGANASLGLGVSINSQSGVEKYISPNIGFKLGKGGDKLSVSLGKTRSVNSIEGLKTSLNTELSFARYSWGLSIRSYLNNSFSPDIEYPFEVESGTYSGALGTDFLYVDPGFRLTGYYTIQKLRTKTQYFPAVGIMYERENIEPNSLMDFNREKKLPYYFGQSKIIPVPYRTPDIFNLNAQGLSMTFSVNKNDIGLVGDAQVMINSHGTQAGIEANLGNLFKIGGNIGTSNSNQFTKRLSLSNLKFENKQNTFINNGLDQLYQQFYLKNNGEINRFDHTAFKLLGGYEPFQFNVIDEKTIDLDFLNNLNENLINKIQPVRQSTINYLTAIEASGMGFDKEIKYYYFNGIYNSESRVYGTKKEHHLSEISVTQPDGMKYIFGLPVYNTLQREVTFNVGNPVGKLDEDKNLVEYSGTDNSIENNLGIDNFFESTETPPYVTQFLITAVLSPDYRDLTLNGISDDDPGNYVKFNYYKEDFEYYWRTPLDKNKATYNRGLRSDDDDDKGTYVFGEKELYYVHSIESKTEIAIFYYSQRKDGYGVEDENRGINFNLDMYLRKLDSIKVYSIPDKNLPGNLATPIKTMHFDYGYSLCPETENSYTNTEGKLTLNKVSFTYENSKKGKLTPYEFRYGKLPDGTKKNPEYHVRNVNRWGYYQKNNGYSDCNNLSTLSNIDFPYSSQDKTVMDENAYAWNLTDITIPGGGKIKINYESHDYAYVQDKTAGQMFIVKGLERVSGKTLYNNYKIYFELPGSISRTELKEKYLKDITDGYLYYKFYVELRNEKYEYITGYAEVDEYGVEDNYGYVKLKQVDLDDEKNNGFCNPILKSALQFMRINRNKLIFNPYPSQPGPCDLGGFAKSLPEIFKTLGSQIDASISGVNEYCILPDQSFCQYVDLDKSFIRLYNPTKMKLAGGSRVYKISIEDNFDVMSVNTHPNKLYTTNYYYTTEETDPLTNKKIIISSGVADYEPMLGGDEIPLKQPVYCKDIKPKATDNEFYVETPVNESLFPAPHITYGKVTQITNETKLNVGKTGKIVNEFYTAKDYPVKVDMTTVSEKRDFTPYNSFQIPFVAIDQQHDFATVSQGYSIILNNMSGLPKATWVYNQNGDRISGELYEYFSDNDNISTIDKYGNISRNSQMGLSVEYTIDGRKSYDYSVNSISQANFNMALIGIFPIPLIVPLYTEMTEEKQFQSIVVNKVIHRNGILKSKTVFDQSASVTTENLAFDEITGEAILTQTTNEFSDKLYSFKYPAYWMYEGMGPSYVNTKLKLTNSNFNQFLKPGDELRNENGNRLWVKNISPLSLQGDCQTLQDDCLNSQVNFSSEYQVYNSGAKNLLNSGAGQVVTWNYNPIENGRGIFFDNKYILNSSAIEYYDYAVLYCNNCDSVHCKPDTANGYTPSTSSTSRFNDYLSGKKGNWKPKRTWFYLDNRTTGNIRESGLFVNYNDFWAIDNESSDWTINSYKWEWKEKVNLTDVDGQTIETEDRISRKVTNLLGYKNTLIIAQAFNSAYGEAYSEGFEDYNFSDCNNWKMNFTKRVKFDNTGKSNFTITDEQSHTGKYSLELPNDYLTFTTFPPEPNRCNILSTECNCIGGLYPEKNKEYLFSCWVKVNKTPPILSCDDASVEISVSSKPTKILKSEGPVIEGWQRIMGKFETSESKQIFVTLKNGQATTFFDDLRIIPMDGNMVSYVYDDLNLRLTYILNENNYFTKYEYNNQGELIRIKQETEEGIITKQEGNQSLYK